MRLIDADVIHELLADELKWLIPYGDDLYIDVGDDIRDVIESIPTAYDPDKVVEALEKEYQEAKKEYNLDGHSYYEGKMIALDNAIEIVKKGGVE